MGFSAAAIGISTAAAGTITSISGSMSAADANKDIAAQEMLLEQQRMKAMELDARRKKLEVVRQEQVARSMALTSASGQGAQFGSGLQGGYGQIQGQSTHNLLGIDQSLLMGRNMFNINSQISQDKMQLASAQSTMALGSGMTSFGGSLASSASSIDKFSQGFGKPYDPGYYPSNAWYNN